jgi:hypothetical protein
MVMRGLLMVVSVVAVAGCGDSGNGDALTKWMGTTRHLRITGTIMGEMLDINLSGAAAQDTAGLWCEREYQAPTVAGTTDYTQGHNSEVRIKAPVTVNGVARLMDLGLKRHDFQTDPASAAVTVIPRDDANSPCTLTSCTNNTMWLSWTWRDPSTNAVMYKMAAQSGQFTMGEFVGTPDTTGLEIAENSGNVGGFATGQWSATENLAISFDANCTKNNIDNSY